MNLQKKIVVYYFIFALSGFSGLIYESVWSHYLKLFLGHAAYAQALVLVIFMGGMALGAWLTSKIIHQFKNLLMAYAVIEGIIGLMGLGFHNVYVHIAELSYNKIFPALDSPALVHTYKWLIAAILILPQSLLLGTTFPLMSNGVIRLLPDAPGRRIAMLYFCNSIGAAIGILVAGFYLISKTGLPGTILAAGLLNILIALAVYFIARPVGTAGTAPLPATAKATAFLAKRLALVFLFAAFITGAASFIYEIAWIRMLSMVLGSSTHAFELMLSAFITGLALGGLYIRKHIERYENPLRVAAIVQIAMGLLALATVPLYNYSFEVMAFFMSALGRNEDAYILFNLSSHLIALAVMLPATFCAGMTLPLFTFILLKKDCGEQSIGYVYAANTIGAIIGVLFTLFIGMPVLGLKGAIMSGAFLDIALGLALYLIYARAMGHSYLRPVAAASILIFVGIGGFVQIDPAKMASGVYRTGDAGAIERDAEILAHMDGQTASISVIKWDAGAGITISTNGKPDAAIAVDEGEEPTEDESTMILSSALPLAIHHKPERIANIGFGSGMSTHTLLLSEQVKQVDSIEIETKMIEGAKFFQAKNHKAYSDPRSRIYIEDAKTFLSTHNKHYDIIISEPSNPWVSGIASLFTIEFYNEVKQHINAGGLFVQWLHAYESNIHLIASILKAISASFADYQIYAANDVDLLIIASPDGRINLPGGELFNNAALAAQLKTIGVNNIHDLAIRFLGNKSLLDPHLHSNAVSVNSDFFPVVDQQAARARFISSISRELQAVSYFPVPILQILIPELGDYKLDDATQSDVLWASNFADDAQRIYYFLTNKQGADATVSDLLSINLLKQFAAQCSADINERMWVDAMLELHIKTVAFLHPERLQEISAAIAPECEAPLSDTQSKLLGLYSAFGENNPAALVKYSRYLLDKNIAQDRTQREFLFSTLLLGLIATHDYQDAMLLWDDLTGKLYQYAEDIPFPLQVMRSFALEKMNE